MIWKIVNMDREPTTGCVLTAHWTATEKDGDFVASCYGTVSFTPDIESEEYLPYENLTEEIVVGWVQGRLGKSFVAETEATLKKNINMQKNPPIASGVPWDCDTGETTQRVVI